MHSMRNLFFILFLAFSAYADDSNIWFSNIPGYVTGTTTSAGHNSMDVNATLVPGQTENVNLIQVGGASITLGQKTQSASIPVTIASDQVAPKTYQNSTAVLVQSLVVGSGAAVTFFSPATAVSVTIEASSSNTVNLRCAAGSTATTTFGLRLEPGRSIDNLPTSATITCIAESSSGQEVDLQWISQ